MSAMAFRHSVSDPAGHTPSRAEHLTVCAKSSSEAALRRRHRRSPAIGDTQPYSSRITRSSSQSRCGATAIIGYHKAESVAIVRVAWGGTTRVRVRTPTHLRRRCSGSSIARHIAYEPSLAISQPPRRSSSNRNLGRCVGLDRSPKCAVRLPLSRLLAALILPCPAHIQSHDVSPSTFAALGLIQEIVHMSNTRS